MATQDEIVQEGALAGDIDVDKSDVDKLHKNAIGLPGVLYFCLAGSAPISAMLFNVPPIASQSGAPSPPVVIIFCVCRRLLGVPLAVLSTTLHSSAGFYTSGSASHWTTTR